MSNPAAPAIDVRDLLVHYGSEVVLHDVSFSLPRGKLAGVIAPNGGGKTTLIKAILGLVPATGSVAVCGGQVNRRQGRVAYVPQIATVNWRFPATVRDVV